LVLGLRWFGDNINVGHLLALECALIGVPLLEGRGVGSLVGVFLKAMTPLVLEGHILGIL
jgi:hypothetical protein